MANKTAAVEDQVLALERRYWEAIRAKDAETAAALSDESCIVVGAQGVSEVDRETLAGMVASGAYELGEYELANPRVRAVAPGVATVAYEVEEELTVEGEPVKLKAYDASVWVRRDGEWLCALHTESPAGDPFGRR